MEHILDQFEEEHNLTGIDASNLFIKIFTRTKDTFRYIYKHCPEKNVHLLLIIGGLISAIGRMVEKGIIRLDSNTITQIIGGTIGGYIMLLIYAWTISVTGKMLGGKATATQLRTPVAWSVPPRILGFVFLIPQLVWFEELYITPDSNMLILLIAIGIIQIGFVVWSVVIMVKGVSILQEFSNGRAFLNIILPTVIFIVLAIFIFLLFDLGF